jgi:hypothetical protein
LGREGAERNSSPTLGLAAGSEARPSAAKDAVLSELILRWLLGSCSSEARFP